MDQNTVISVLASLAPLASYAESKSKRNTEVFYLNSFFFRVSVSEDSVRAASSAVSMLAWLSLVSDFM